MFNKVNLELKCFCEDFSPIREELEKLQAKKGRPVKQIDYFFNLPEEKEGVPKRLKLRIAGRQKTLVLYSRDKFSNNRSTPSNVVLFPIKDKRIINFLKRALGVRGIVEKIREQWKKEYVVFNLDRVKGVGNIFEIEIATNDERRERDEATFNNYKKTFSPYLGKIVSGSNIDLVLNQKPRI